MEFFLDNMEKKDINLNKMDKRGIITFLILIVIGLVLTMGIFFGLTGFININKFLLLGGAVVILSIIFGLPGLFKSKDKATGGTVLLVIILIGGFIIFLPQTGILEQVFTGGFEVVSIGRAVERIPMVF